MSKLVITSIVQLADLCNKLPGLLSLNAFIPIRDPIVKALSKKGCKCNMGRDLVMYRPQFEAAMAVMSEAEQNLMKSLLKVENLCYYQKDTGGKLKLICF